MEKILCFPDLIIRRDLAGLWRDAKILTTKHFLEGFMDRLRKKILCQSLLDCSSGKLLQNRLTNTDGGGHAPALLRLRRKRPGNFEAESVTAGPLPAPAVHSQGLTFTGPPQDANAASAEVRETVVGFLV